MERMDKRFAAVVKALNEETRRVRLVITTETVDRDGDVVVSSGALLDSYRQNPIVLYSHMPVFPVGNCTELLVKDRSIEAEVEFFSADESPLADRLYRLYSRGKMRGVSVGFIPREVSTDPILDGQKGRTYLQWELLEFSLVAIPSNREALSVPRREAMATALKSLMPEDVKDPEASLADLFAVDEERERAGGETEKGGRVLAKRNMDRIKQAVGLLAEVLQEEELRRPPESGEGDGEQDDKPEEQAALAELQKEAAECRELLCLVD
jgi:HK97 family phage prohead protease